MRFRLFAIGLLFTLVSCGRHPSDNRSIERPAPVASTPTKGEPIRFEEVGEKAGIGFTLGHNGKSPLTILETSGGGCAFLDYDSDGWPDILLVGPHRAALYHNKRNGTFEDVTARSGIDPHRYWMGCAVGDYDGDGRVDIFLTGYRCCALLHNEGAGRFRDVTASSGISGLDWSISAVFADLDGDSHLDLFVSQYLVFDASKPQLCTVATMQSACGPEVYQPLSGRLFVNVDGSHFRAATWKDSGKTWGALASDILGQGHPALYLANDMVPGDLWAKQGGKWSNVGGRSGTAYDGQGNVQGGMGVDTGDYDNDGRLDLLVTTYFAQQDALYHNDGNGLFTVTSGTTGLGPPTMPYVAFGAAFVDLDNDGWLDIVATNGHVRDNVNKLDSSQHYAQPLQVFRNVAGKFEDVSAASGVGSVPPVVGRGLAVGDYDRDGRPDVLICNLEGRAVLLHNVSPQAHWLDVRLRAPAPNRDGIGAMVRLRSGGTQQLREIRTCGSVMSGHEPEAHFGLKDISAPPRVEVTWPDGSRQEETSRSVDTLLTITRR